MINIEEAKVDAWVAIANLIGKDYFRKHYKDSCDSYFSDAEKEIDFEYFMGFDGEGALWTVFARVSVNRETEEVTFLDYKTPDGKRMENPIKPIRFA